MENYVLFVDGRQLPIATFPANDDDDARQKVHRIIEKEENKNLKGYLLFKNIPLK